MGTQLAVEIAVQDVAGADIALSGGATRIELCSALVTGGLTPSLGTIEGAVAAATGAGRDDFVHVLIRPRPGGFVYDNMEIATMVRDIRAVKAVGAAGVVIGALLEDRSIDVRAIRTLVEVAEDLTVTFHRALDIVPDPLTALDEVRALGVERVLTSGQAAASIDGRDLLAQMVEHAAGGVQIMAGGGVAVDAIPALAATGIDAVHLSAKTVAAVQTPSGPGGGVAEYDVTSPDTVRAAVQAARGVPFD
ncbi:copper homeostasis protein CutC [Lysinibacter sp. HNR]|uniref:copper homeostasis protein CutC n=1 Tax=Lysinibacter sp. HNR TaxID=3031408 RepID=UPI002435E64C|nr:copper homeostasis protein CutC [Lysinibacter sp. HNR]WGD37152.1 copper homeostasis protein CutC [Lysinibacter sp. HNR]